MPDEIEIIGKAVSAPNAAQARYILVVGIGGSISSAKAVYDALYGHADSITPDRYPKLVFVDSSDAETMKSIEDLVSYNKDRVLLLVISKSGTTQETLELYERLKLFIPFEQTVFVTQKNSPLWHTGESEKITLIEASSEIPSRFSAFTSLGLTPLLFAGIDGRKLARGGDSIMDSDAVNLAEALIEQFDSEKKILDFFFFHPEMESFGKWLRQIFAESLGKKETITGEANPLIDFIPTISVGPEDIHSVGQLYLAGPANRFTVFFMPSQGDQFLEAIQTAYREKDLPFLEISVPEISEYHLGRLMELFMRAVKVIGDRYNIDISSQPEIEEYKKILANS